jgi:outer membrane protein TolC
VGLAIDQKFALTDSLAYHAPDGLTSETATGEAIRSRADLANAEASVRSAEANLRAQRAQRLPAVSVTADYGRDTNLELSLSRFRIWTLREHHANSSDSSHFTDIGRSMPAWSWGQVRW